MEDTQIFNITALLVLALIIGGMAFFAAVMTPLVFTKLPSEISGPFILVMARYHYTIDVCVSGLVYFFVYSNI